MEDGRGRLRPGPFTNCSNDTFAMWGPMRSSSYTDWTKARSLSGMVLNEPVVVEMLKRLQTEGLSRHDAAHAIGSILAVRYTC